MASSPPKAAQDPAASREGQRGRGTVASVLELWRHTDAQIAWVGLVLLSLAVTACELCGLTLVFALIHLLDAGDLPASVPGSAWLARLSGDAAPGDRAVLVAILAALVYLAKNVVKLVEVAQRQRLAARAAVELSTRMLTHYLRAPYTFHLQTHSGELIRNLRVSVDRACYTGLSSGTAIVSEVVVALAVILFVCLRAPWPALAAAVMVVAVTALMLHLLHRVQVRVGREGHQLDGRITQHLQDTLQGVREIKLLGREAFFADVYRDLRERLGHNVSIHGILGWVPRVTVETAFIFGLAALVLASTRGADAGTRLLPLVGLFAFAGLRLLPSLTTATFHLGQLRFSRAHIENALDQLPPARASLEAQVEPMPFHERIVLEGVGYTYPDTSRAVLADVQLSIARGESIGIVGPTGGGKSTLVGLMIGLLTPSEGRIQVDGKDLAGHLRAWQAQVGFVPQSVFMLDASLRENIALGVPAANIDQTRVQRAVEMAQLSQFVASLPDGLETRVGELGVRVSGGERQRLAVARALYGDPEVLVFDEATASLDNQTELELTRAIEYLQGRKTMIIIAHRLTTVRRCDRLVFLADGRIRAVGTFEELLARDADFERVVFPESYSA